MSKMRMHSTLMILFAIALCVLAIPLEERRDATVTEPSGSVVTTAADAPTYTPTASIQSEPLTSKFQWQIYKSCSADHKKAINLAWAESKNLSDALASYKFKSDFQPAMGMYMGDRSTYSNYFRDPPYDFPHQINGKSVILQFNPLATS